MALLLIIIPVASASSEFAFITDYNANKMIIVDTSTNSPITNITNQINGPVDVCMNPAGTYIFIANAGDNTIRVYSTSDYDLITTITLPNAPNGMVTNSVGTRLYVSAYNGGPPYISGYVYVIDISSSLMPIIATISTGTASSITITDDDQYVYTALYWSNEVAIINTNTNTVSSTLNGFSSPDYLLATSDTVWVSNQDANTIMGIDTSSMIVTTTLTHSSANHKSRGLAVIGPYLFAGWTYTGSTSSGIAKFSIATGNWMADNTLILTGGSPGTAEISSTQSGAYLYVLQNAAGNASIINQNLAVLGSITLSATPTNIYVGISAGLGATSPQPVYLYVHSYYVLRWENVNISVYNQNGQLLNSKISDNNGGATFNLVPDETYTINVYSATLGINTTVNYTPPNSYYGGIQQGITVLPYTSWLNGRSAGGMTTVNNTTVTNASFASGYQDRDIFLRTNTSRTGSVGYINNSFNDLSRLTTQVTFRLYKLNNSTNNYTLAQTVGVNLNTVTNSTWQNFTVLGVDASNKDYYVIAEANNTYYGNVTRNNPANIPWQSLLPGVPAVWHTYLAVIVVVGIFAASVMWMNGIMGLVGAGAAYVFYSLGWLDTVPGAGLGIAGAVIAAIVYYWSRRETGGLE
jgi:DNA-binding beta-propeller fold protein YncE